MKHITFLLALIAFCVRPVPAAQPAAITAAQPPRRIISLLPSHTEILFALGVTGVIAVSNFCDYPPKKTAALEKAGDYYNPNIEKILSLKPDIVFTGNWKSVPASGRLRRAGINALEIPDADCIAGIYENIRRIGAAAGKSKEAANLVKSLTAKVAAATAKYSAAKPRPRVYIELDAPHWTAGGRSFLNETLENAGGENIFRDLEKPYAQVSWETIVQRNPDVIITLSAAKTNFAALPGANRIAAVRNGRVISSLDKNLLTRPSPRIYLAIEALGQALHEQKNRR
ncbi:MAG: ABC transporter substrate-binding protein [Elusimicrobiales bacterium]|nr:ABC transporter substrate-binding protein [Elusimicrobiales bacterium]